VPARRAHESADLGLDERKRDGQRRRARQRVTELQAPPAEQEEHSERSGQLKCDTLRVASLRGLDELTWDAAAVALLDAYAERRARLTARSRPAATPTRSSRAAWT